MAVNESHYLQACAWAGEDVAQGSVGAGRGMSCFSLKGGIGTASRRAGTHTVGALVLANFGLLPNLLIAGQPVGRQFATAQQAEAEKGSIIMLVATDAPLDARNLQRLAARAVFALARTGSTYSNGSGDFAIAFSTAAGNRVTNAAGAQARTFLPTDAVSGLFEAALDATEEAVYNSLLKAVDTTGNGRTVRAIPVQPLRDLLKKYGR